MEGTIVACLCAAWCRLCGDYAPVLRDVVAEFPGLRMRWIDIEDEADLVGDVDVETFPTIVVIAGDGMVHFAGPLTPQPQTLRRVIQAALDGTTIAPVPAELTLFAARLVRDA